MPIGTTGMFPSEYDPTTNALLQTVQLFGVTDKEIEDDQEFLVSLMMTIGAKHGSLSDTIKAMDVAFLGLLYHRHMPYQDDDGVLITPERGAADYVFTMNVVTNALIVQVGVPPQMIAETANDAAQMCMKHLDSPPTLRREDTKLHEHMIALFVIGLLVHRFMPLSNEPPTMKGN